MESRGKAAASPKGAPACDESWKVSKKKFSLNKNPALTAQAVVLIIYPFSCEDMVN